jgi:hypothetical protein
LDRSSDRSSDRSRATPGELVGIVAGAALAVGSFLPFYRGSLGGSVLAPSIVAGSLSVTWTAWSDAFALFPVLPAVVLTGTWIALRLALVRIGVLATTSRVARTRRYDVTVATAGAAVVLAYVARDLGPIAPDTGAWLVLLSAAAVATGAFLRSLEAGG